MINHHKKNYRNLATLKMVNKKDITNPENFLDAKRLLSVVRSRDKAKGVWNMMEEANNAFNISPPLAFFNDEELILLQKSCTGRVPIRIHPTLYRAIKLTFPLDIGGVAPDGLVSNELGQGSLGSSVGVLNASMFVSGSQL